MSTHTAGDRSAPPTLLDAAAGRPLHPAAREVLDAALARGWADPRALHGPGRDARLLLDNAREVVAECLGVRRDEVWFVPPADAVVRGFLGLAEARAARGARDLVVAPVEHAQVRHAAAWWTARRGGDVREAPVDRDGRVDPAALAALAAAPEVAAAALQLANHEIATTQPVADVHLPEGVDLFVDASASLGLLDLPSGPGWSAAAGCAKSWGGPAWVGLMLVRHGARWSNPLPGEPGPADAGGGLPDVAGALAAAAALRATLAERDAVDERRRRLVDRLRTTAAALPDVDLVGDPVDRLPHLLTFSCLYLPGDALVRELDREGFAVASGSACTASTLEPSHVLAAVGALTHGNVRVSLAPDVTEDEVERFCGVLPRVVDRLRAEVGL
ncbi:aminotransferase class V-fold PLP-dependent enzyme [Nocardioides sp. GY 10127]|uniref:aminotransferase class V-fold PLP-dependent enzyme n=1 Tax=Nocardioides sp. GY 10127 TaxID=2569762 RepID=UPI0010A8D947|nr:aminotransferase class V-fold PLP-dependent enzyme [Nocardioides sp. GY 10127]TIC80923.1 aminotransferase class V-fold PLP-dependent enzyme [Nocardioides sp. GY 10127]